MAKPFAIPFYKSSAWQGCRDSYISQRTNIDGGTCEECGQTVGEELHHIQELAVGNINDSNITLNHDNLSWLCKDCHFKAHRKLIMENLKKKRAQRILNDAGYYFDEDGEMKQTKTYIVWGSPASGKTTYVREHKRDGDLVIDLDLIKQAISMCDKSNTPNNLLPVAIAMRDCAYEMLERGEVDCKNKWVIASLPNKKERLELTDRLGAELIYIDADYMECIRRVDGDSERKDKTFWKYLVDQWWEQHQP